MAGGSASGVQSSGIDANNGEMLGIISSCQRSVVTQDMVTNMAGKVKLGPGRNVRDSADQSIMGLVLRSQGRPRTISAEG